MTDLWIFRDDLDLFLIYNEVKCLVTTTEPPDNEKHDWIKIEKRND